MVKLKKDKFDLYLKAKIINKKGKKFFTRKGLEVVCVDDKPEEEVEIVEDGK